MTNYSERVSEAVAHFWQTRVNQEEKQGSRDGNRDYKGRSAVTGGRQLDGFVDLLAEIVNEAGIPNHSIHKKKTTLPGYFRPTKEWDLVVKVDGELLASIEFKSHVGPSFGNNFNNRVEEALGNSVDLLSAYRQGAFKPSQKPWLGWLMILEDVSGSRKPARLKTPHYNVLPEFEGTSYAKRYELFCERLMREQLYDASCLILSNEQKGLQGGYSEPSEEFNFKHFAVSLSAHANAFARLVK